MGALKLLLAGLLTAKAACCPAQSVGGAAAYQRDVARVQASLVRSEVGYQGRISRTKSLARAEESRRALEAAGENASKKLLRLPEFPARVALRALALRVARAQTQAFAGDYKRVIELNVYQDNSLQALQAYYAAFDAALGRVVVLNDSLRAARRDFADEFNLPLDEPEMRVLDQWLAVQHRVADLLHYQHQVVAPVVRARQRLTALIETVGAADVVAYEKARRQLAAEVATAKAELALLPDFANLDVLYRNAAQELMNTYTELCANELAQISTLLQDRSQAGPGQLAAVNQNLADFTTKVNAANQTYQEASKDFFKTYHPVLDQDNRHTGY